MLFWLRQTRGDWKLFDWEWIDSGVSASELTGRYESVKRDSFAEGNRVACQILLEVDGLDYSKHDEVEKLLRKAESCQPPAQTKDYITYLIMDRWSHRSRSAEVARLAKRVSDPDRIPGIHVLSARSYETLGETEEELASIARVEQLVGFRPELAKKRAQALQRSHRRDEALVEWRRLNEYDPSDVTVLSALYTLLNRTQRSEILTRLKSYNEPAKIALQFATLNAYRLKPEMFRNLSDLIASIAPDSDELQEIEVLRLSRNNEHRAAALLLQKTAEREADPVKKNRQWERFLREMNSAGELMTGISEHPDFAAAFRFLVRGIEDGESMLSVEELPPLIEYYQTKSPEDPQLTFYKGIVAAERHQFAEADTHFKAFEQLISERKQTAKDPPNSAVDASDVEINDLENLVSQLRYQRSRARYELGEDVKILEDFDGNESVYQTLASFAVQYRHWEALERLNRSFATVSPKSIWLAYYEARQLLAAKDYAAVREKIRAINILDTKGPMNSYFHTQLERELLTAESSDPLEVFTKSGDRSSSFNQISRQLLVDREWQILDKLCDLYRRTPDDPEIVLVQMEMAWQKSDDEALIALLVPWPKSALAKQSYMESIWRERLVGSLLRQGRWNEAREHSEDARKRFDEVWPLIKTCIARQNVAEIKQLIDEDESIDERWPAMDFASDPLLRPILMEDAFEDIRGQRQFAFPSYGNAESLVVLLRNPIELTEMSLMKRLQITVNPIESPPQITTISPSTFVVHWRGVRFVVESISKPFFSPEFIESSTFQSRLKNLNSKLDAVFVEQCAYLRIASVYSDEPQPWNSPTTSVREFASQLLPSETIAAIDFSEFSEICHLVSLDESQAGLLASRRPFTDFDCCAVILRPKIFEDRLDQKKKSELIKLATTEDQNKLPPLAKVQLCHAANQLHVDFQVFKVRQRNYGGYELVVEYAGSGHFPGFPELRRGIQYVVPLEHVVDVGAPER